MWENMTNEEEIMKMFAQSMSKEENKWYLSLPPKSITSFHQFLMIFREPWVNDEEKYFFVNYVDVMLWVEI